MVVTALFITGFYAFSGQELERMDNSSFENPARPGAVFSHDDHNETAKLDDCTVCHHLYEDGKLLEGESSEDSMCSECHGLVKSTQNPIQLQVAFHKRCRSCHFDVNKGPVFCGECHKRV